MTMHDELARRLIVVGDRVLIKMDAGEERLASGLILPQTVAERQQAQYGRIVAVGPGVPMPLDEDDDEPWKQRPARPRHIPMQGEVGRPGDLPAARLRSR